MKTASDSIAVIQTRLPDLDRRALSEAWFSALHLARDNGVAVPRRRAADVRDVSKIVAPPLHAAARAVRPRTEAPPSAGPRRSGRAHDAEPAAPASGREAERSRVREVATRVAIPPPLRASFTLMVGGARVQMLVRREGPTLRITAICATRHLEAVGRALASADLAMRLRGHAVETRVRATGDRTVTS